MCRTPITRKDWRGAKEKFWQLSLLDNALALSTLQEKYLPDYDPSDIVLPHSVHLKCLMILYRPKVAPAWFLENAAATRAALLASRAAERAKTRTCSHSADECCALCGTGRNFVSDWQAQFKSVEPPALHPGLPPPAKRHRRASACLSKNDLAAWNSASGGSVRSTARGADSQRERHASGESPVDSTSGAVHRRQSTIANRLFRRLFRDVDCEFGDTDGGAVVCTSLYIFIALICFLRGKLVSALRRIKLNIDGGRGSVKLSMQIFWDDDPIWGGADQRSRRRTALHDNGGLLDNGAKRTWIVGLIAGAKETFESVRFLIDRYDFVAIRELLPDACDIVGPNDMKVAALCVGIGPSGSRYPQASTIFSPYRGMSLPDVWRTPKMVLDRLEERRKEEEKSGRPTDAKNFESVEFAPIRLLQELFMERPIADFLVPPQLHLVLGIVKTLLGWLAVLDRAMMNHFLRDIAVVRNPKHGDEDFRGNECRRILRSSGKMIKLLPPEEQLFFDDSADVINVEVSSEQYRFALLRRLVELFMLFGDVVSATMGLQLRAEWRLTLQYFEKHRITFARYPVRGAGRDDLRLTMKLECLRQEVPACSMTRSRPLSLSTRSFRTCRNFIKSHRSRAAGSTAETPPSVTSTIWTRQNFLSATFNPHAKRGSSVSSWNRRCLPFSSVVQDSIDRFNAWTCTCEKPKKPKESDPLVCKHTFVLKKSEQTKQHIFCVNSVHSRRSSTN